MKEKINTNGTEDLNFIKEKAAGAAPEPPEALSRAAIEALAKNNPQKKNLRPVRAAVSVAVAASLAITSFFVLRKTVFSPKNTTPQADAAVEAAQQAALPASDTISYGEIAALLETAYENADDYDAYSRVIFNNSGYAGEKAADEAVNDSAAYETEAAAPSRAAAAGKPDDMAGEAEAHSETNLRDQNAAEADTVKTDGRYLYFLRSGRLLIADPAGEMPLVAAVDLTDADFWGDTEFYLQGNTLIALSFSWDEEADKAITTLYFYDIADPAAPALARTLRFDGELVSSRIVNGRLLLVTSFRPNRAVFVKNDPATFLPAYTIDDAAPCYAPEGSIVRGTAEGETEFTTVSLLPLSSPDAAPETLSLFGSAAEIYCTGDRLYLYNEVWEPVAKDQGDAGVSAVSYAGTCIRKFDVSGEKPVFAAEGRVNGWVLNAFALDDYNGYLRVAAGVGEENRVYVLNADLQQVGESDVIGAGEQIESVRFMGDYGYVVTFMQTDPLFVLDLSDPAAPKIAGEVKLPGFSAYLHPAGEGQLLGVGYGGTEDGLDGSAKISVFDVRDPAHPAETGSLVLEETELNTDYKAFVTLPDGSFLLPYTNYRVSETAYDGDDAVLYYTYSMTPGALHVAVQNGKPVLLHDLAGALQKEEWGWGVVRALFIGDAAFVVSTGYEPDTPGGDSLCVERFSLATGESTGRAAYPLPAPDYGWVEKDDVIAYEDFYGETETDIAVPAEPLPAPDAPQTTPPAAPAP